MGDVERVLKVGGHPAEGGLDLLLGNPQLVDVHAVELAGEPAYGGVALLAYLAEDGGHVAPRRDPRHRPDAGALVRAPGGHRRSRGDRADAEP